MIPSFSNYLRRRLFIPDSPDDHLISAEEQRYRGEMLTILFQWTRVIALAMAAGYLLAFMHDPIIPTASLFITFFSLFIVIWGCLAWLNQERPQWAMRVWLTSATTAAGIYMLLMPSRHILVGMIGLILFVRVAMITERLNATFRFGLVAASLYLFISILRRVLPQPDIELGLLDDLFLYLLPIVVMVIFILLDRTSSHYLKDALRRSETARADLVRSYAELEAQKAALERSEAHLSTLTAKLERSNQDLQTTNEELKSFAQIISHDLRAPLINLRGFAAQLRSSLHMIQASLAAARPHLSDQQQQTVNLAFEEDIPESLGFIEASVIRMDYFIDTLLKLARAGRRELNPERINLAAVVQRICKSLAHQIEQAQVQVSVGKLPDVVADLVSIEQIMGNLLTNAVQYLDPERPGRIEITAQAHGSEFIFQIRDNGCGIAAADMPKVFEPFRRAGTHQVSGEGMGLAYVQTLVRRHGGRIWCQSKLGEGTTFSFSLPKRLGHHPKTTLPIFPGERVTNE